MNKKKLHESMMNNISKSLKSVLDLDNRTLLKSSRTPKMPPLTKENYPHLYKYINEVAVVRQIEHAKQFANRVKTIANNIERDCKSYDEKWALGYAEQLRNAADKMLSMIK